MTTLSAVLIVKNEHERIARCLKTLKGVDQIVVLDTGSADDTVEEARAFGAETYFWQPISEAFHFSDARNAALAYATGDWVLSIDADETLRPGSLQALRPFLSKEEYDGYRILHLDRGLEDYKFRVFRREKFMWNYRVHEVLVPHQPGAKLGTLEKVVLEHLPRPGKEKEGRNLELLRMTVQESPEHHSALMKLGMELFIRDDWEGAYGWFGKYLAASGPGPMDRSEAMARAGLCLAKKGDLDGALKEFERSHREAPYRREPLWYASLELIKATKVSEAMAWLNRCLQVPVTQKKDFYLNIPAVWDKLPVEALAWCETQLEEAERKWRAKLDS